MLTTALCDLITEREDLTLLPSKNSVCTFDVQTAFEKADQIDNYLMAHKEGDDDQALPEGSIELGEITKALDRLGLKYEIKRVFGEMRLELVAQPKWLYGA